MEHRKWFLDTDRDMDRAFRPMCGGQLTPQVLKAPAFQLLSLGF